MMEKKKKIFYLDFIRVISMIIIVTYHFFVHFAENNITGITVLSKGKWGMIGVTLFFMISGASLIYNYGEKINIKEYVKKRFLGIYPMFWIAYIFIFVYIFYGSKTVLFGDLPKHKLLISLFAMDGYLSPYTQTLYLIGEWFLGCIVLIYILFPLLRIVMNKYPKTFFTMSTIINFSMIIFFRNGVMPINKNIIVCTYSFILGMYIIRYVKEFKLWHMIITLLLAIGIYVVPLQNVNFNIQVLTANFVGYNLFIVLAYIGQKLERFDIMPRIFALISKYSYAIFLVHHYIIMKIENTFQNQEYGISGTVLLYTTCWIAIIIFAKLLYMINKNVLDFFKKKEKVLQIEESEKRRK